MPAAGAQPEALQYRRHDLVQAQPALGVQLRGEPDLGVGHPVRRQVLGALRRHPDQRVALLHHADGMPERLQVQVQVPAVRPGRPALSPQLKWVTGGQARDTELIRQLNDGRRPQPTVEVVVQQHLRHAADLLLGKAHVSLLPLRAP